MIIVILLLSGGALHWCWDFPLSSVTQSYSHEMKAKSTLPLIQTTTSFNLTVVSCFSWTEPSARHGRRATGSDHEPTAALLPHPLHSACRPVQGPPEQEEGLVVRALRRPLDRPADGAAPGQAAHRAGGRWVGDRTLFVLLIAIFVLTWGQFCSGWFFFYFLFVFCFDHFCFFFSPPPLQVRTTWRCASWAWRRRAWPGSGGPRSSRGSLRRSGSAARACSTWRAPSRASRHARPTPPPCSRTCSNEAGPAIQENQKREREIRPTWQGTPEGYQGNAYLREACWITNQKGVMLLGHRGTIT